MANSVYHRISVVQTFVLPRRCIPTFDEFADMLDQTIERVPERFLHSLTGGFNVQEETTGFPLHSPD